MDTATLKQIARRVNVSRMTVSNVLNGYYTATQSRAVERAERIRQVAREMGYMPNAAAKAVREGRFGVAAVLLSTKEGHSHLPAELLTGLHDSLGAHDMRMEVARLPDEALTSEERMPKLLRELSADGLLVDYTHAIPAQMIWMIQKHRMPAVWINSRQQADCVHPDDEDAGYRATAHLLETGHRRIAYVDYSQGPDFPSPHYSATDRRAGYERAMSEARLPSRVITAEQGENIPGPERVAHARVILESPDRPTAVVTYGRAEAVPILFAATQLGLVVPRDLSLVNFGELAISYLGPPFATMLVPQEQMGREAVAMLLAKVERPGDALAPRPVTFVFEPGQTIAPPMTQ